MKCRGSASHLPDAGVGLAPDAADEVGDAGESPAGLAVQPPAGLRVDQRGLEQVAVDVELGLLGGVVADPDRARAPVAVELQRALGCALAAVEAVEDLQARVGQLRRVQQPPEERLGLARAAELQQGVEREGRVAHPAEAVVPVALAADLLGQRRGRRRRDRPRRGVEEQLERQRAADHGVAPRAVVGALRGPAPPVGGRGVQPPLDVLARREDQRLLVGRAQRDQRRAGRSCLEAPEDRLVVDLRLAGLPGADRQRVAASDGDRDPAAALDPWRHRAVAERRRDAPSHRDPPREAVDSPDQLPRRSQVGAGQGHRVGDPDHALRGGERGLQHVGVGQIASLHLRGDVGLQLEASAAIGVEDRREHAGRIEVGQAQPVDRPVACDQRDGPAVPDRGVVTDRDVASRRSSGADGRPRPLGGAAQRCARHRPPGRADAEHRGRYASATGCRTISVGRSA